MPPRNSIAARAGQMAAWRHDFHRHPELGFAVHRTAARVAELLRSFGCDEVTEGVAQTGVVAVIRGRGAGPVTGLRADMDALPIVEATGAAHASTTDGVMHACGHDGHTAMLLGAAQHLAETRAFDGTAVLIFQPAEEGEGGGRMMAEVERVVARWGIDAVYALHNMPGLPVGRIALRSGAMATSGDSFEITVTGKGGHGALPHLAVDPIVAASAIVTALQSVVGRNIDPRRSAVLTVTAITSDSEAFNVIPSRVRLRGTMRAFDEATRARIEARLRSIVGGVAAAHGTEAAIDWRIGVPATINTPGAAALATEAARAVSDDVDPDCAPMMASEDFSFLLSGAPGAYVFVGNGDSAGLHHPAYDFNDAILPVGASLLVEIVERARPVDPEVPRQR